MSRSSITVWKSARQSLGDLLPLELPSEFSEPAWAALVFVRACTVSPAFHTCLQPNVVYVRLNNRHTVLGM